MIDLSLRANIIHDHIDGKDVFVYEDHRYLLYVTWYAVQKGIIAKPATLVYFDRHDDLSKPSDEALSKISSLVQSDDAKDILSFVEWDLNGLDSDWLKAMMEFNLIDNAILIGAVNREDMKDEMYEYVDLQGRLHTVYSVSNLWSSLSHKGDLSDGAVEHQYGSMWGALGWKPSEYPKGFTDKQILLDFDLDCFTYEPAEWIGMRAWDKETFDTMVDAPSKSIYTSGWTGYRFLQGLLEKARYITIAKESYYCGGTKQSEAVLQNLYSILKYNANR